LTFQTPCFFRKIHFWAYFAVFATVIFANEKAPCNPIASVDPFIGVDGHGAVFPGATVPFGLISLSPDCTYPQETSGYSSNKPIIGFSHNHSSGTGGDGRYGNLLVLPQTGPIRLEELQNGVSICGENASPGYYAATIIPSAIKAELTCDDRVGIHRYTFNQATTARILFDFTATRNTNSAMAAKASSKCLSSQGQVVDDRTFEGQATFQGGWGDGAPYTIYFSAVFSQPFAGKGSWNNQVITPNSTSASGSHAGLYGEFAVSAQGAVELFVGVSYLSLNRAREHVGKVIVTSFDQCMVSAQATWKNYLSRISVKGGTPAQKTQFYTGLYRSLIMPSDVSGDVPGWPTDQPHFWNHYTLWDTYLTIHPLFSLITPEREAAMITSLIDIYEAKGWLPDAWLAGDYGSIQGGTHADIIIADAIIKGLKGFDREKAYAAIRKDATQPSDGLRHGRYVDYFTLGYITDTGKDFKWGDNTNTASRVLEYSRNDAAIAAAAQALGKTADAQRFAQQSMNGWKLWNPENRYFCGKDSQGNWLKGYWQGKSWLEGFDPANEAPSWRGPFYEGSPWQYAFSMQHDVQGLIQRHGGKDKFMQFIDRYWDEIRPGKGTGFHRQGNEPGFLTPWLHTYIGRPDKNVERVRQVMVKSYNTSRRGLPGNEDCGALSSWYVFAAMGIFPNPGQDVYLLASPVFSEINIQLGNEATFTIKAIGLSESNIYVQSATLNGKNLNRAWLRHSELSNGELILQMGAKASDWGTLAELPPSVSNSISQK
jgi:predicted alpha-1,2-mannosidase